MNALRTIEAAQEEWDAETIAEHGFNVAPGDAILQHGATEDENNKYRIAQFLDIAIPTDNRDIVRALVAEYVATETDAGATYQITQQVDTAKLFPTEANFALGSAHPQSLYELERIDENIFQIRIE